MMMKNAIPSNGTSKLILAIFVVLHVSEQEVLTIDVETPAPRNLLSLRILYVSITFYTDYCANGERSAEGNHSQKRHPAQALQHWQHPRPYQ